MDTLANHLLKKMVDGKCLLGTQLLAQLAEDVQCSGQQRQQW